MLPVFLDCSFLIATSAFSKVYCIVSPWLETLNFMLYAIYYFIAMLIVRLSFAAHFLSLHFVFCLDIALVT